MNKDAVQHERGPRKPKLQKDGTPIQSIHHHSNNNNNNVSSHIHHVHHPLHPHPHLLHTPHGQHPGAQPKMPFLFPAAAAAAAAHFSMASLTSTSAPVSPPPSIIPTTSVSSASVSKSPVTGESASSPGSNSSIGSGGSSGSPVKAGNLLTSTHLPSPLFHPTLAATQQNILSLLADRTHDIWAKAAITSGVGVPPPPPPLLPLPTSTSAAPSLPLSMAPTWESLQETTARLLFMAVRWVKCLMPFQTLSTKDQLLLLQESWKDLFLLHLSQWAVPWDLSHLLNGRQSSLRANGHIPAVEEEVFDMEVKTMQVVILLLKLKQAAFYLLILSLLRRLCVDLDSFLPM